MAQTATLEELKDAVSISLRDKGVLRELKAKLRAEVYRAIEAKEVYDQAPEPCPENVFVNELVREYLEFNEYNQTLSVFLPESGQRKDAGLSRAFMAHELHIDDTEHVPGNATGKPLPLLYSIIQILKDLPRNCAVENGRDKVLAVEEEGTRTRRRTHQPKEIRVEDRSDDHFPVHPLQFKNSNQFD